MKLYMRTYATSTEVEVRLSRRNLKALLAKLDGKPARSFCTITRDFLEGTLVVIAEEDEVHYAGREPGEMHPATEEAIE